MTEPPGASPEGDQGDYLNPQFLRLVEEVWSKLPRRSEAGGPTQEPLSTSPDLPVMEGSDVAIGRFQILKELGRGGSGIVLLAFDPSLRRTVALKVPAPEALLSSGARHRFLSEARAVAALRHPNIVTIHEAGQAGPIPYIVMEFCEQGSLADWLAERPAGVPVAPRSAALLVARIADGVQHAHDRGILHRDLKPSNILIQLPAVSSPAQNPDDAAIEHGAEPDVNPLVTDFGLAKSLDATQVGLEATLQGLPLGTIPYMASEAARGDGGAIGCPTDVYSMGVILFELLTGRRPFAAPSRVELLEQILNAEPLSPSALRPDLPIALERICLRCLRKSPADRYQKASEVARELRRFLNGSADAAHTHAVGISVKRMNSRRKWGALAGLALTLALALGAAGFWWRAASRQSEINERLRRLESADVAGLPALVPKLDPGDPSTAARLARLFAGGTPTQKLAAALVLAKDRNEYRDYCYDQLLQASPSQIEPLARLLQERSSDLPSRLRTMVDNPAEPDPSADAGERQRASAACALIALGRGGDGWSLLRFAPDPQARSYLIHLLGPAGVRPSRIVERLIVERDPSIRRALIQSLGAVPKASWSTDIRDQARSLLLDLYEHDPDPGVHGSAKWLLLRWNVAGALRELDGRLARAPQPSGRDWRISPSGLTLMTVRDPKTRRSIEVADTEVTLALFNTFRADHVYHTALSPGPECPVSSISYVLAAQFCNWLSEKEGIAKDELAYRAGNDVPIEPVDNQSDRAGYRLLTSQEFERACRAGTTTPRYHGSSSALLREYAWYGQGSDPTLHPPARLKPNDFGLFDMLGNADEMCQGSLAAGPTRQAAVCGGSFAHQESSIRCDLRRGPIPVINSIPSTWAFGFRVARTITRRT